MLFKAITNINTLKKVDGRIKHGKSKTRIMNIWMCMRARCSNPKHQSYQNYGARGISVCDRWQTFDNFLTDMGEPPSSKHTLDRIDNDGNYEPGNCKWATYAEQRRNARNNVVVFINGKRVMIRDYCREHGINYDYTLRKIRAGESPEAALFGPRRVMQEHTVVVDGVATPLKEYCRTAGLRYLTVIMRIRRGRTPEESVSMETVNNNYAPPKHFVTLGDGTKVSLRKRCEMLGVDYKMVIARINRYGYSIEEALAKPSRRQHK